MCILYVAIEGVGALSNVYSDQTIYHALQRDLNSLKTFWTWVESTI